MRDEIKKYEKEIEKLLGRDWQYKIYHNSILTIQGVEININEIIEKLKLVNIHNELAEEHGSDYKNYNINLIYYYYLKRLLGFLKFEILKQELYQKTLKVYLNPEELKKFNNN